MSRRSDSTSACQILVEDAEDCAEEHKSGVLSLFFLSRAFARFEMQPSWHYSRYLDTGQPGFESKVSGI